MEDCRLVKNTQNSGTNYNDACAMLLWVYIHTRQAWNICLATVGFEHSKFQNYNESRTQFQLQEFHNSNNSITNYKMF
jgi:hypothetical protein